jgi:hypothetical protein
MKKKFVLLLLAFCTSNLFAQEVSCDEIACPEGGVRTNNIWTNHNLYYYIYNYTNNPSSITPTQYLTAVQNAFSTWSQYSDFTFTRTYNSSQADIILMWESNNCGNQGYNQTAAAHSSQGEPDNGSAFIHFNNGINFTMTSPGYIMEAVTLREIGHVLGLDYIPNQPSAAMYEGNVTITNLTGYDLSALYIPYTFPWSLTGPNLISQYASYNIYGLHPNFTTSWILDDLYYSTHNCLTYSSSTPGVCVITRDPNHDMWNAELTAVIFKNGIEVKRLTKSNLYAYSGFRGQYTSGNLSGNINYTYYFNVKTNTATTITSPNFYGATVTYGSNGATPTAWGFHPDIGVLYFTTSTPSAAVVINVVDGCGNNYVLYAYAMSQYSINVSNGANGITVTLVEDGDTSKDFTPSQSWTLEVRNASTGVLMATQSSTCRSESISTVGWPNGVYIVKATIGDEELTEKVIVK